MRRKVENYIHKADIDEEYELTAHEVQVLRNYHGEDITDLIYASFKFGFAVGCEQTENKLKAE